MLSDLVNNLLWFTFMSSKRDILHRSAFESQTVAYVMLLAQKDDEVGRNAAAWLGELKSLQDEASALKRDAREEKTLRLAIWANAIAAIAAITAIVAIIIAKS
jgi:hypothetical protein